MGGFDRIAFYEWNYGTFDFGGGASEILSFRLPPGWNGRLRQIGVSVTEVFATDATLGMVKVGTAADDDAYAHLNIADEAADKDFFDQTDDTDAIIAADVDSGTLIQVTLVNGTDASAVTGQGQVILSFELWTMAYPG